MINYNERIENAEIRIDELSSNFEFYQPSQLNQTYIGAKKILHYLKKESKDVYILTDFVNATKMSSKDTMESVKFLSGSLFSLFRVVFYIKSPEYKEISKSEFNSLIKKDKANLGFKFIPNR